MNEQFSNNEVGNKNKEGGVENNILSERQEEEKFRVVWKSKNTEATGHGEYIDKETADVWLEKENKDHPELEHWLESDQKENEENPEE